MGQRWAKNGNVAAPARHPSLRRRLIHLGEHTWHLLLALLFDTTNSGFDEANSGFTAVNNGFAAANSGFVVAKTFSLWQMTPSLWQTRGWSFKSSCSLLWRVISFVVVNLFAVVNSRLLL